MCYKNEWDSENVSYNCREFDCRGGVCVGGEGDVTECAERDM